MNLRDYQTDAIRRTIEALPNKPILVSPTGSGKTVMVTELVKQIDRPTLWIAHRKELIEQAAASLVRHGLSVGIVMSSYDPFPLAQVQVASIQTLIRRDPPPANLIVVDEAHHCRADSYRDILDKYPDADLVGLTATPFRLDGAGLGDVGFGEIILAAWPDELCDAGFLHRPRVWALTMPNLRGVKITAGDYNVGQLAERVNDPKLMADIVDEWQKHAAGRRTVCFAVDIEHSKSIVAAFQAAGIPAEHLDGRTSRDERESILNRLRTGETNIVSNCMVLTEGWDLPALECAIIARPTASLNLHLQMLGRIMRACEGKAGATVLDLAGNHHVHGLVTRRLNYTLASGVNVGSSEPLGLRRCRNCGLFFETNRYTCPECGWVPTAEETKRQVLDITGDSELTEFDDRSYDYRRQAWDAFEAEREAADYKPGWSYYRFKERFGVEPTVIAGELVDVHHATMEQKQAVYEQYLKMANEWGYNNSWASHRYRDAFGVWPKGFVSKTRLMERLAGKL
jgi:superfamily II DNA or RNA helicase